MSVKPHVIDVDASNFDREVLDASHQKPIVVDFWAEWCQPCQTLAPFLEKLAAERDGEFILAKIDVDRNQGLASSFGVDSIPHVAAMRDGKVVDQFIGLLRQSEIRTFIDRLIPTQAAKQSAEAFAIESTDPARAAGLYRSALEVDSTFTPAMAGLADLAFASGDLDECLAFLNRIGEGTEGRKRADSIRVKLDMARAAAEAGPIDDLVAATKQNPDDLESAVKLGKALAAAGRYQEALDVFISVVEKDRSFGDANAKSEMVKIFGLIGQSSDMANQYRSRLASALY
jgi:putative thioredoxin